MGMASEDLLVTLQILPGFFSNCLFLALYDSVVLVRRVVSLLRCSRSAAAAGSGEWRPMLTSAGLRSIWNSFLLDAYKQVKSAGCTEYSSSCDTDINPLNSRKVSTEVCACFTYVKSRVSSPSCFFVVVVVVFCFF